MTGYRPADGRPLLPHKDGTMDLALAGALVHLAPERLVHQASQSGR